MTTDQFDELLEELTREAGTAEPRVGMERRVMARVRLEGRALPVRLKAFGWTMAGVVGALAVTFLSGSRPLRESIAPPNEPARALQTSRTDHTGASGAEERMTTNRMPAARKARRPTPVEVARGEPVRISPLEISDLSIEPLEIE